jgi:GrpB-like predicted nucleotidyltransferase (UPF0157 family)
MRRPSSRGPTARRRCSRSSSEESPLAVLRDLLAAVPEPSTEEGYAALEQLHEEADALVLQKMADVWEKANGSKVSKKSFAWI